LSEHFDNDPGALLIIDYTIYNLKFQLKKQKKIITVDSKLNMLYYEHIKTIPDIICSLISKPEGTNVTNY